ncbi:MAG: hypothetical protein V4629_06525 [Pseudomonadota bacterium]
MKPFTKKQMDQRIQHVSDMLNDALEGKEKFIKKKKQEPWTDDKGSTTDFIIEDCYRSGKLSFALNSDVNFFRAQALEGFKLRMELIKRYNKQESINILHVSTYRIKDVQTLLSLSLFEEAKQLAESLIESYDYDSQQTAEPTTAMYYAYRGLVAGLPDLYERLDKLAIETAKEKPGALKKFYESFYFIFTGIVKNDATGFEHHFPNLTYYYNRKRVEKFNNGEILFNVLGLLNLARYRGLDVEFENTFIPKELWAPVNTNN